MRKVSQDELHNMIIQYREDLKEHWKNAPEDINNLLKHGRSSPQPFILLDFSGLDFKETDLSSFDFSYCNLKGVNFGGCDLNYAKFIGSDLGTANLSETDLFNADMRDANLIDTDFRGAILFGADMRGCDVAKALIDKLHLKYVCLNSKENN